MGGADTILAPGADGGHWLRLETLPGTSLPGSGKFGRERFPPLVLLHICQDIAQFPDCYKLPPTGTDTDTGPFLHPV